MSWILCSVLDIECSRFKIQQLGRPEIETQRPPRQYACSYSVRLAFQAPKLEPADMILRCVLMWDHRVFQGPLIRAMVEWWHTGGKRQKLRNETWPMPLRPQQNLKTNSGATDCSPYLPQLWQDSPPTSVNIWVYVTFCICVTVSRSGNLTSSMGCWLSVNNSDLAPSWSARRRVASGGVTSRHSCYVRVLVLEEVPLSAQLNEAG